jgi:hypothetical protein
MEEILSLANKLAGLSFATLLLLILWGSFKRIWVWGRDVTELEVRLVAERKVVSDDRDYWKSLAERVLGLAEMQGQILRVKEGKELTTVSDVNKRLLEP